MSEQTPLLRQADANQSGRDSPDSSDSLHRERQVNKEALQRELRMKRLVTGPVVLALLITAFVLIIVLRGKSIEGMWLLRGDPDTAARRIVSRWPVIDGHVDLPALYRGAYANNISAIDLRKQTVGHVDIPRLREGGVGSFWWSTWVACPGDPTFNGNTSEADFIVPSWRVRDTLEQIDVAKLIMEQYPETFQLALSVDDARGAMQAGRIAGWIGVEGGHQLGNSLGVLRQYYALGVRYMTLTHTCHNAFADSGGFLESLSPLHYGLSPLGKELITEMNRLGMIVDLSHTSDQTAIQALTWSRAPVMWSHSSSREVWNVARNVPNEILARLGTGPNQRDGVVMINFAPYFVAERGKATVEKVADHVEMVAKVAGKRHVGLGSDFDGIESTPIGLEDVSKYPNLVAILIRRGWTALELSGLLGGNMLRVFDEVERIAKQMRAEGAKPSMALYSKRPDLPAHVDDDHLH